MLRPQVEFTVTIAFTLFILMGLFLASQINLAFSSDLETFSGPRAYPRLILLVLLALNLATALGQFRGMRRDHTNNSHAAAPFDKRVFLSMAMFGSLIVFVLTFERVGYILTMVPLLVMVAWLCGAKNLIHGLIVSLCLTALCLVVFRYGLSTVLPEGLFGIDAAF